MEGGNIAESRRERKGELAQGWGGREGKTEGRMEEVVGEALETSSRQTEGQTSGKATQEQHRHSLSSSATQG